VTPQRRVTLRAVGKEQDDPEITKVEKPPEDVPGLMKHALARPIEVIPGARAR